MNKNKQLHGIQDKHRKLFTGFDLMEYHNTETCLQQGSPIKAFSQSNTLNFSPEF